eukprot:TRINITY_DN25501_c0_g1_i1.p1 TRINITY_DN25501_c0_g1~~TRINITY_DN25501_c0_g1_i1.p1  ORF type:complete len:406 (+),score=113.71 TRINITY_DN25501_c0_g1_i1:177-1220(+)
MARSALAASAEVAAGMASAAASSATASTEAARQEHKQRVAAEAALSARLDEFAKAMQAEVKERCSEIARLASMAENNSSQTEALMEMGGQLDSMLQNLQEERLKRSEVAAPASAQSVEALRRACEELRRRSEESELAVGRLTRDLALRIKEEIEKREAQEDKIMQKWSEEVDARIESEEKTGSKLASLKEALDKELEQRQSQCSTSVSEMKAFSAGLEEERKDRLLAVKDIKGQLSQLLQSPSIGLQAEDLHKRLECQERNLQELFQSSQAYRGELRWAVQELEKERTQRVDGLRRLREDCREAIQREIGARMEETAAIKEEVGVESRARREALSRIHQAISECGAA